MSDHAVPRRVEALLESLGADTQFRIDILGDLAEEHALRARLDGERAARRWYYRESLRIAPYLLRDWRRGLRPMNAAGIAAVLVLSTMATAVTDWMIGGLARFVVFQASGIPMGAYIRHWQIVESPLYFVTLLAWTAADATVGGFVAASVGRRARLTSAFVAAGCWASAMIATGVRVPRNFLALNVATMAAAAIGGGILRVLIGAGARRNRALADDAPIDSIR